MTMIRPPLPISCKLKLTVTELNTELLIFDDFFFNNLTWLNVSLFADLHAKTDSGLLTTSKHDLCTYRYIILYIISYNMYKDNYIL